MQKTVKEIIDMIDSGKLCYNQSTQRKFVYADIDSQLACGKTTKAGSLINAILEDGIQLPAVYFWQNTDTNQLNIHDGKQRILSLYYFIKGQRVGGNCISTYRHDKETLFTGLSAVDQNRLLDYKLDIVMREGSSKEEERSFYLINTNSVNLTSYECVSGMLHGQFLTDFENYIDAKSKLLDKVKPIGRGEQAYKILLTLFNINNSKKVLSNDKSIMVLTDELSKVRNFNFIPINYKADDIIECFSELMRGVSGLKEERALAVADYIIKKSYNANNIVAYYRNCMRQVNDISCWEIETHKTFIDAFINGLQLDPQRYFSKDVKDKLYQHSPRCSHINDDGSMCSETAYSKLEVDHIQPWSKGGRTIIDNARLLCKSHNSSKGNRED